MAISVVINTYNAAKRLPGVLSCLKGFDEILVCDMESTDNTVEIARSFGARVVTFPKKNYNYCEPARNYAISQARYEWVLVVDADELVSSELRRYLHKFTQKPGNVKGIYIPRKNYVFDRFHRSTYPDYRMRFFARNSVDWPAEIHSHPIINGEISKIPSNRQNLALVHISPTVEEMIDRCNRYTSIEARKMHPHKVSGIELLSRPFLKFVREYFGKAAFRCGAAGLIASINGSVYEFYRLAKIYEYNACHKMGKMTDAAEQENI